MSLLKVYIIYANNVLDDDMNIICLFFNMTHNIILSKYIIILFQRIILLKKYIRYFRIRFTALEILQQKNNTKKREGLKTVTIPAHIEFYLIIT